MFDVPRRAIVVLGQSLNRDGTIPATLESRARTAADHWLEHQDAVLVLTGGDPAKCGVSEALRMQQLVEIRLGRPVPPALLLLEEASRTTVGNAVYCKAMLRDCKVDRIDLITSEFHLPRAAFLFDAVFMASDVGGYALPPVSRVPAATPPPKATDTGINAECLAQRLRGEHRFAREGLAWMLDQHNPDRQRPIPEPPAVRMAQVRTELDELLESESLLEMETAGVGGGGGAGAGQWQGECEDEGERRQQQADERAGVFRWC